MKFSALQAHSPRNCFTMSKLSNRMTFLRWDILLMWRNTWRALDIPLRYLWHRLNRFPILLLKRETSRPACTRQISLPPPGPPPQFPGSKRRTCLGPGAVPPGGGSIILVWRYKDNILISVIIITVIILLLIITVIILLVIIIKIIIILLVLYFSFFNK